MTFLRRSLPSMNGLFTFEAAARCGSFSRAADELNVTPAAVSRMMSRLEEHLDTTLFLRQAGGVTLTEAGQLLFDAIARGFAGIEGALSGSVNDVDLGMRFVDGPDSRHEAAFVMPEILLPICSPDYMKSHVLSGGISRMPDTTINLSDAQPDWSKLFTPANGGETQNSMIFSDYAIVVQAALLGQGVALGWLNVVAHWLRTRTLVPAREQLMVTGRRCHLVRLRDKPARPIVGQVRDWMIAELTADIDAVSVLYPALNINLIKKGA